LNTTDSAGDSLGTPNRSGAFAPGILIAALLLFFLVAAAYCNDSLDDPYITYRYAHNMARGYGLVWNVGEPPVEGYTTFFWAVLHAPFLKAGVSPLLVSRVVSLLSGALMLLVLFSPLNRAVRSPLWRTTLALLLIFFPAMQFFGQSGMETLFFAMLAFVGTIFWLNSREAPYSRASLAAASALYGLAVLTRPEGLFLFGIVLLMELAPLLPGRPETDRLAVRARLPLYVGPFLVCWLPHFLWAYHYYGYPVPNTVYAKYSGGSKLRNLPLGIQYVGKAFSVYLVVPFSLLVGLLLSGMSGEKPAGSEDRRWQTVVWPMLLITAVYTLYMLWMGGDDTAAFPSSRLFVPIVPLLWLGLAAACETALERAPEQKRRIAAVTVLGLCLFCSLSDALPLLKRSGIEISQGPRGVVKRVIAYLPNIGAQWAGPRSEWIDQTTKPDAWIAVPWAGRVPYYTDRPTIDMLGLSDVHIAHTQTNQMGIDVKTDPDYVLSRKPELIFVHVDPRYYRGEASFEESGGWRAGDKRLLDLLKTSTEYTFDTSVPASVLEGGISVFRRKP